jgi:hypothetical protein
MPAPTGPDNDFYSYNIGPVHFVMLSSERNNSKGSAQYEWMKQDLQGVDRAVTPWAVVSVHRPLYRLVLRCWLNLVAVHSLAVEYGVLSVHSGAEF